MTRPSNLLGMHHVALFVQDLEACKAFYVDQLGMKVEWQPDPDNIYLSSGSDNLALHRAKVAMDLNAQVLDHIGFILQTPESVDTWYEYLLAQKVPMKTAPRTHRDGARSFYCFDPSGNNVQMMYHPPISPQLALIVSAGGKES